MRADNASCNAKAYIDFLCIEETTVKHILDEATHFCVAQFVYLLTINMLRRLYSYDKKELTVDYRTRLSFMNAHNLEIIFV